MWWSGFEPQTLHILCIVHTNWVKLTKTLSYLYNNSHKVVQKNKKIKAIRCILPYDPHNGSMLPCFPLSFHISPKSPFKTIYSIFFYSPKSMQSFLHRCEMKTISQKNDLKVSTVLKCRWGKNKKFVKKKVDWRWRATLNCSWINIGILGRKWAVLEKRRAIFQQIHHFQALKTEFCSLPKPFCSFPK